MVPMTDITRNIEPLWTFADVAAYCQVGIRTVKRWRANGDLPAAVLIGGAVRYRPDDIRQWAADRKEVEPERARVAS